jgi:hypothetical protein
MAAARKAAGLTFRKGDLVLVAIVGEPEDAAAAAPRPIGSGATLAKTSGGFFVICEPGWGVAKVLAADDEDLGVHYLGYADAPRGPNCPYDAYSLLFTGEERVPWTGTVSKSAVECIIDEKSWNASGDFARLPQVAFERAAGALQVHGQGAAAAVPYRQRRRRRRTQ